MVFTQIFRWLTVVIVSCGLGTGCVSYRTVRIEMLEPAKVFLEKDSQLAFFDRNISYRPDTLACSRGVLSRKEISKAFKDGFNCGLEYAEPADTAFILQQTRDSYCRGTFPQPVPSELVKKLHKKLGIDYIISLECHYLQQSKDSVYYNWLVRLYSPASTLPVDTFLMSEKVVLARDSYILQNDIMQKSWDHGKLYAERITQHWSQGERRIYRGGRLLRLGNLYLKAGKTEEAVDTWAVAGNVSPLCGIKGAVNIAWVYENIGDLEYALQVLRDAKQAAGEQGITTGKEIEYLEKYIRIVEDRIGKIAILDSRIKKETTDE